MKFPRYIKQLFVFINLAIILCQSSPVLAWTGKVVSVSDGDTIKVIHDGKEEKVRLYGIDTPESAQPYGNTAKKYTASLVAGKVVDVEPIDTDRYGRIVGLVKVDGKVANEAIVASGLAWVYRKYCEKSFCDQWLDQENVARTSGLGLWTESNPTPPWEFRHPQAKAASQEKSVETKNPSLGKQDVGIEFHGNRQSGVFHRPGCRHYNCKNCTSNFTSRDEALGAGYRSCKICNP